LLLLFVPLFVAEDLPPLVLPPIEYPGILAPAAKDININSQIMDTYINNILPGQQQVHVLAVAAVG
jgi:hypothetical protein